MKVTLPIIAVLACLVAYLWSTPKAAPEASHTPKIITHTVVDKRVVHTAPEPRIRDCIGCMTAKEFASIKVDMGFEYLDDMFGIPPGNVDNDGKTFYPAASGGRYWIYYNCANCKDDQVQKIARKEYQPDAGS